LIPSFAGSIPAAPASAAFAAPLRGIRIAGGCIWRLYFLSDFHITKAMTDEVTSLDATDLRCPLPVLRTRKILKWLPDGALLDVRATDAAAPKDFEAFCREAGHTLINIEQDGEVYVIRLRKKSRDGLSAG
jgi:tRNA 2-thiouridine synthesizing protein A